MARISTYPKDTNISLTDKLLGTDADNSSVTKNFEISDLIDFFEANIPPFLIWRGTWSNIIGYEIGDVVEFNNSSYVCIVPINRSPADNPTIDTTSWDLLSGLVWRGPWVFGSGYVVNDVVEYLGSSYICTIAISNSVFPPPADQSRWDLLAEKGDTGPQGPVGPAGPIGLVWRGDWSGDNEYLPTDAVSYQGSSYYCLNEILTSILPPPSDPTNWDLLAEKGDEGPQLPQSAFTVKVNNTNATAVPLETTYTSFGLQTLIDDPSFSDNQTPTGTVNKSYNWHQIGNLVTVNISVEYATWLVETGEWIRFNLPSDMPDPVVPTGFGSSNRVLYTGVGSAYETDISITQTTGAQTMSLMRANGTLEPLGFHFLIPYTIDALNPFKVFRMTLQYFTE
jgi:hypothetical protein